MANDFRTKIVGVKVTPSEFEVLNEICNTQNISKSAFIRKLISNYIAEMDTVC